MRVSSALIFALCLLIPASLWGGELYNWTDENGIQHFSNQRPENIKNIRVIQAAPESTAPAAPAPEPAAESTPAPKPETAPVPPKTAEAAPEAAPPRNQLTPEDIDRYLGPCYERFLKKKTVNGSLITTNANWVYQIGEALRPLVVKYWQVGDRLKICREKGFIFNITRDPTIAIEAVRVRKGTS